MKIVSLLVFTFITLNLSAQYTSEESEEKSNPLSKLLFKDRLYTGGSIAFSIQEYQGIPITLFQASPFVGYRVTHEYSVGVGVKYIYIGAKQANYKYSVYGGSIFNRYKFTENFFAHAEFELLRAYNLNPNSPEYGHRAMAPMLFAGAGYNSSLGGTVSLQIMVLYDFIDDVNSPYKSGYLLGPTGPPLTYRIGIGIGM